MPPVDVPERLVAAAVGGDRDALEELLRLVADDVARLAQRMLWHPQDAEDATQEILVKVATRLGGFRGEAQVTTWIHRIAVNHLLTTRRRRAEDPAMTFAAFGHDLARGPRHAYDARGVDEDLLAEEVGWAARRGCCSASTASTGWRTCSARCSSSPATTRLRSARSRRPHSASGSSAPARAREFMRGHCGLVDPANPCRCRRRIGAAIAYGRVDPSDLLFARRVDILKREWRPSRTPARCSAAIPRSAPIPRGGRRHPRRRRASRMMSNDLGRRTCREREPALGGVPALQPFAGRVRPLDLPARSNGGRSVDEDRAIDERSEFRPRRDEQPFEHDRAARDVFTTRAARRSVHQSYGRYRAVTPACTGMST